MSLRWLFGQLEKEYGTPDAPQVDEDIYLLIETVLSQNTNDNNRDKAMENLLERFPTPQKILEAEREEIYDAIKVAGLGNVKSERIQKILELIKEERGDFDLSFLENMSKKDAREWLLELPGIGFKTASVVLNFGFNKPAFPVDTHCKRVLKRIGIVGEKANPEEISRYVESNFEDEKLYPLHLNVIKHGREVCKAPTPLCESCFLTERCDYFKENKS